MESLPVHPQPRVRLRDLVRGVDGATVIRDGAADITIRGITEDSRAVKPGYLFAAIKGASFDGRGYIDDAISRGAVAVLSNRRERVPESVGQVLAANPRGSLGRLCSRLHGDPSRGVSVVGVTGTNGKTTSTYLLQHIFNAVGYRAGRLGTVDNDYGDGRVEAATYTTPTAEQLHAAFARMVRARASHAAIEVSSQALDQQRTAGAEFEAALFTNLTQDHLDYHGSLDVYANCKAKLFSQVRVSGFAAVNGDDPFGALMIGSAWCDVRTWGFGRHNNYRAIPESGGPDGSRFRLTYPGGEVKVRTPLVGQFNVANALAAFTVAHGLGVEPALAAHALTTATGAPGRLERVTLDGIEQDCHVFVDYAHTPDALEKAASALRATAPDRELIVVVGCGGDRDRTKRPLMGRIAATLADRAILTSDNPRSEDPRDILRDIVAGVPASHRDRTATLINREEAIHYAVAAANPGATVLVAGKGHEDYQIIGDRTIHFDDREVARDAIAARMANRTQVHTGRRAG